MLLMKNELATNMDKTDKIYSGKNGDFIVGEFTFEIGGAKKSFEQIKDMLNSFVATGDIEAGVKNKIPLWLFGFWC